MDSMNSARSEVTCDHNTWLNNPVVETDKKDEETIDHNKMEWLSMKTRITALVEKADVSNVELVADQILNENIIKGKGVFCQTVMKSQSESPESSDVYAAVVAIINSKFPEVGYLLVKRAVLEFKEAHDSGDKQRMQTASRFLAQLVNQRVVYVFLPVTVLMLLLVNPSSDNVEVAAAFCSQCGSLMMDVVPHKLKEFLSEFHRLLTEGHFEKRVQVLIVRLFASKKRKFKACGRVINVVDYEDRVTHDVCLFQDLDPETSLDDR
ncbi:hypothetical protein C2S53_011484 [Perilla frutescens var. hirtella]|uniref:MIF4G domain-containing protein n=1 Tax=Perilla frutescens var. hirtella TaxID=608512 RepID=A0AAD4J929_PERFH|nr:hypothetical protein C2S53_011484 [Perilla frutescens var. hirtella]